MADDDKKPDSQLPPALKNQQALSLAQLLGAPIHALIDAETHAALSTANFLKTFGFENGAEDRPDVGDLRMLRFRHKDRDAQGRETTHAVELPLLSLLPIPALQIRDAELDYTVKVVSTETNVRQKQRMMRDLNLQDSSLVDQPVVMRAALSSDGQQKQHRSMDMQLKMKVRVEQSDLPAGLGKLLNYAAESMSTRQLDPGEHSAALAPASHDETHSSAASAASQEATPSRSAPKPSSTDPQP